MMHICDLPTVTKSLSVDIVPDAGRQGTWVNHTNQIPRWDYGIGELIAYFLETQQHSI